MLILTTCHCTSVKNITICKVEFEWPDVPKVKYEWSALKIINPPTADEIESLREARMLHSQQPNGPFYLCINGECYYISNRLMRGLDNIHLGFDFEGHYYERHTNQKFEISIVNKDKAEISIPYRFDVRIINNRCGCKYSQVINGQSVYLDYTGLKWNPTFLRKTQL